MTPTNTEALAALSYAEAAKLLADELEQQYDSGDFAPRLDQLRNAVVILRALRRLAVEAEAARDNLKADLENALDTREFLFAETRAAQEIAAAALAEREALRADAERYRWLRSKLAGAVPLVRVLKMTRGIYTSIEFTELDAAIDAARAAMKGTQ